MDYLETELAGSTVVLFGSFALGEDIYSYGIWHENNCPVRISGGVLKTCICDKTLTSSMSEKLNKWKEQENKVLN